jgi:hypothetical protein
MRGRHLTRWASSLPTILVLAAVILLTGAFHLLSGPGQDGALGAAGGPTVTGVSPVDGAKDCSLHQVFTVTFDQAMDASTLTSANLYIYQAGGFPMQATVTYDAATMTATLTPKVVLEFGATYYVTLSSNVKSAGGLSVAGAPLTWHFDTVKPIVPHITGFSPADGQVGCPLTQVITITFDIPMDPLTFTSSSFYFAKRGGFPLPATISYNPNTMTATLTPVQPLEEAGTYDVSLTSAVRGLTGTFVVGTPKVWSFSTILVQPPALVEKTPADGAQDQPLDVMVTVTFDREMDRKTVTADTFYIEEVGRGRLDANLTANQNLITLTPAIQLNPETTYKVTITTGIKNVKGASVIGAPISWTFKTKRVPLPYSDVPLTHPYFTAIFNLAKQHVISGYTDGTYRPSNPVTRQQFAKMICRALGYQLSEDSVSPFTDFNHSFPGHFVDPNDVYYPDHYIAAAYAHGVILGKTDTTFAPYDNITRYQVITMLVRAIDDINRDLLKTPDAGFVSTWDPSRSEQHGKNARLAEFNGLLEGLPLSTLDPLGPMTRGEIAQLEWNLINFLP